MCCYCTFLLTCWVSVSPLQAVSFHVSGQIPGLHVLGLVKELQGIILVQNQRIPRVIAEMNGTGLHCCHADDSLSARGRFPKGEGLASLLTSVDIGTMLMVRVSSTKKPFSMSDAEINCRLPLKQHKAAISLFSTVGKQILSPAAAPLSGQQFIKEGASMCIVASSNASSVGSCD